MISTQRVYDTYTGERRKEKVFLVDRIWPRGIKKSELEIDGWLKEVAPSTELRRRFHHDPERWQEFKKRYYEELNERPEVWKPILEAAEDGNVTLLYGSKNKEHNNAIALKLYLEERLK
jgi:uncharacterized protein YeaO (DUF488 family)